MRVFSRVPALAPVWRKLPEPERQPSPLRLGAANLLVEGLGVGGGGRNVGVAGSLVGAGGELELVGSLEVGVAGLAVGTGVVLRKVCAESKKPQEGNEIIGFDAAAIQFLWADLEVEQLGEHS